MRVALLSLLLLLTACGAGGLFEGPKGPSIVHVRVVSELPNGWGARYERHGDEGTISVRSDLVDNPNLLVRTLVHELGHSMGLEHGPDPACAMYETNVTGNDWDICGHEVAAADSSSPSVVDAEAPLAAAALEAVVKWNAALARAQFSLVP
jgi:hypothetical protein